MWVHRVGATVEGALIKPCTEEYTDAGSMDVGVLSQGKSKHRKARGGESTAATCWRSSKESAELSVSGNPLGKSVVKEDRRAGKGRVSEGPTAAVVAVTKDRDRGTAQ